MLSSEKPCMIARFGSIELDNVVNYLGRMSSKRKLLSFILNKQPAWWLELDRIEALSTNAGFFPKRQVDLVDRFCKMTIDYGFPLAAHVKHKGKQAIHLGGTLQLLFGIKGNR